MPPVVQFYQFSTFSSVFPLESNAAVVEFSPFSISAIKILVCNTGGAHYSSIRNALLMQPHDIVTVVGSR